MDKSHDFMAQWNYQDPAASALRFHALLPEARAAADLQLELELLTQIARTHSLQRQFAEAHQLLDEIEPRLTDATPRARLRALLERGRTFNSAGDKTTARTLFEQAWQWGLKSKELYLAIDAAHMIAIAAPLDEQSRWHQLAMELAERSQDEKVRGWLASLYNNQGWTLFELGRFDEARVFQQKCLAWHEQHNNTAKAFIARWSLARLTCIGAGRSGCARILLPRLVSAVTGSLVQGQRGGATGQTQASRQALDRRGLSPLLRPDSSLPSPAFCDRWWRDLSPAVPLPWGCCRHNWR